MKTILDLEEELFMCRNRIKYIIKSMGIIHSGIKGRSFLYNKYQVELIKENNPMNYEKYIVIESKMNYETN